MERLFYSSLIPSKLHASNRSPFLPQLGRSQRLWPSSFPTSFPVVARRFNPLSCCSNDSSFLFRKAVDDSPVINLATSVDTVNWSKREPLSHFLRWVAQKLSRQPKEKRFWVIAIPSESFIHKHQNSLFPISWGNYVINAGTVILLAAVFLTSLHPAVVSPAFASFQDAVKTGGPAAVAVGNSLIRSELLSSAWTGFFAGCLHTLSGPDHLAALAPLSIGRSRMESAAVGALWGCGHDAGQVLFGLLFLLLKDRLHIEVIRTWGTRVVGFTLLIIGAMGIREASEVPIPVPCVALENGECDVSEYEALASHPVAKKKIGFATFATGIVHGLQPDALMMILPALALPSRVAGAAFLLMFLVGTVIAMGSYTVFIGSCSEALKERVPRITEKLTWASSLIAIALGLTLLISQFFGFSLY